MQNKKIYVVAGGTFDHLHAGHELFLKTTLEAGDHVTIGITSDNMALKKPLPYSIEKFSVRKACLKQFISGLNHKIPVQLMKLENPFGISISDRKINKIIVTKETKPTAIQINIIRKKNRLKALKIVVVPYVKADDSQNISSFRIRKGEISRHGSSFYKSLISRKTLHLPDMLRVSLREPLGHVFSTKNTIEKCISSLQSYNTLDKKGKYIVSVGDIVSLTFLDKNIIPSLMIYDHKTRREALSDNQKKQLHLQTKLVIFNQPGTIRQSAIKGINKMIKYTLLTTENIGIRVIGEEDLLVLPTILMAPLGSVVCYGQRDRGFIAVTITEDTKNMVKGLLEKFQ